MPTSSSDGSFDRPPLDVEVRRAYTLILAKLGRRDHTRKELARALRRKDFSKEAIEDALARAARERLVDDARLAEVLARQAARSGLRGPRKVVAKLRQKGVAGDTAEAAAREAFGDLPDRDDRLIALAARLYGRARGETTRERKLKALRSLVSRGFGISESRSAIDRALQDE